MMEAGNERDAQDALFRHLYARYYRRVVWYIGQHGFAYDDAKDLAQVTFVRVYERMSEYRREAEWAYLSRVAQRVALNEIRKRDAAKRDGEHVSLDDAVEAPQLRAEPPNHAELEQCALRRKRLEDAILKLSKSLQKPLLLRLAGSSYKEIELALELSEDAVKSRLKEARHRLTLQLGTQEEVTDDQEE